MCRSYIILAVCLLECLLFGGTIFGWSSLVYVLQADGIYTHLCEPHGDNSTDSPLNGSNINSNGSMVDGCDPQARQFSLAFTIGLVGLGLASFPAGAIFDRFGLLTTRLLCR